MGVFWLTLNTKGDRHCSHPLIRDEDKHSSGEVALPPDAQKQTQGYKNDRMLITPLQRFFKKHFRPLHQPKTAELNSVVQVRASRN